MSWGKKDRETEYEAEAPVVDSDPQPVTTCIDENCEMTGVLRSRENIRIDGHFDGEIEARKTVIVGEAGLVRAQIRAANVVVLGTVEGDIFASGETTLHKSAAVTGELQTGGIVVERGARMRGSITIGSDAEDGPMASSSAAPSMGMPAEAPAPSEPDRQPGSY